MSRPKTDRAVRAVAAAVALGAQVAGCSSDIYNDRRETIARDGGDAVAANMVEQMVDPWPRHSNNKNIAFNGERMQRAVECYRNNRVTPPVDIDPTTSTDVGQGPPSTSTACAGQMASGSAQPAMGTVIGTTSGASYVGVPITAAK